MELLFSLFCPVYENRTRKYISNLFKMTALHCSALWKMLDTKPSIKTLEQPLERAKTKERNFCLKDRSAPDHREMKAATGVGVKF